MKTENLLSESSLLQDRLCNVRREIHRRPETGFDLSVTKALVKRELEKIGVPYRDMGKAGGVALIGGKKVGKTILLRADMDALPLQEQADRSKA